MRDVKLTVMEWQRRRGALDAIIGLNITSPILVSLQLARLKKELDTDLGPLDRTWGDARLEYLEPNPNFGKMIQPGVPDQGESRVRPDKIIEFGRAQAEYLGGELEITVHLLSWKMLQEANKRMMRKRKRPDGSVVRIPMSAIAMLYDLLDELPEDAGEPDMGADEDPEEDLSIGKNDDPDNGDGSREANGGAGDRDRGPDGRRGGRTR
jgi:hypothetical protein